MLYRSDNRRGVDPVNGFDKLNPTTQSYVEEVFCTILQIKPGNEPGDSYMQLAWALHCLGVGLFEYNPKARTTPEMLIAQRVHEQTKKAKVFISYDDSDFNLSHLTEVASRRVWGMDDLKTIAAEWMSGKDEEKLLKPGRQLLAICKAEYEDLKERKADASTRQLGKMEEPDERMAPTYRTFSENYRVQCFKPKARKSANEECQLAAKTCLSKSTHVNKVDGRVGRCRTSSKHPSCEICSDNSPGVEGQRCRGSKEHFYCLECLQNLAQSTFDSGETTIRCQISWEECSAPFLASQFQFLESQFEDPRMRLLFEQISRDESRRAVELVTEDDARCPLCDWPEQYPDFEEEPIFFCRNPDCGSATCRRCSRQAQPGHECKETTVMSLSESKEKVFDLFCEGLSMAVIRKCNYICHQSLGGATDDNAYGHFTTSGEEGKCPLYRNTTLLHLENRHTSLEKIAVTISTDFPDLAPLVQECLDKHRKELQTEFDSLSKMKNKGVSFPAMF
ncbi:hypothetical protein ISF_09544 [Cordyceps fumosorosea ARSEF 2679]|uniref:IBR domain-containing protein n=1 Tax=Cordyceps fumosorosea (strain ARSEF 2679) TaxID=1081104 RepID=A0A167GBM4_CORFA|nr:hypothetical protein ISF_09544 [Cordyceps fumosorosea ARSEF 2679]OAA46411.1 hypothetical protein ISF_09544 [Cordyceps fumosorosea ARSEF 2679]